MGRCGGAEPMSYMIVVESCMHMHALSMQPAGGRVSAAAAAFKSEHTYVRIVFYKKCKHGRSMPFLRAELECGMQMMW